MAPPPHPLQLDITALSQIAGSVSIACWVVVFSPQIIENFRRSSAEGLSIVFVVVWLVGDVFNILGGVMQGILPTMIILAVYYTLADIVLLLQCFYYRGFTLSDSPSSGKPPAAPAPSSTPSNQPPTAPPTAPTERTPLIQNGTTPSDAEATSARSSSPILTTFESLSRRSSNARERLTSLDGTKLSPATPLHPQPSRDEAALKAQSPVQKRSSLLRAGLFNLTAILVVCAAGVLGWWLSVSSPSSHGHGSGHKHKHDDDGGVEEVKFNVLGQVFGYICAVLYLGSRIPQLLLNYRRKSTEGVSMLFFMFACLGNLTYVLSILLYDPPCGDAGDGDVHGDHRRFLFSAEMRCAPGEAQRLYGRYFLVNLSWFIGSFGTLLLDAGVFVQYFMYRDRQEPGESAEGVAVEDGEAAVNTG
ncbi:MAG: hypothetical protein M1831_002437 [Alyxoria varia]|nr:MAG: hypothetical protein M1831_002437 [Alyxoria varia]